MFDAARPANHEALSDNYIQPNLGHGLRIWWAFYWPTVLFSLVLVVAVNIALQRVWQDTMGPAGFTRLIALILRFDVYVFYYFGAFFAMAYLLRRNFRRFRIGLLSHHGGEGAEILPPTLARTARVWWAYCWRAVLYRIIAAFCVSFPLGWILGFLVAIFPSRTLATVLTLAVQVLIDGAVGIFVIYSSVLDEDISDFRVALLPRTAPSGTLAAPPAPAGLANG